MFFWDVILINIIYLGMIKILLVFVLLCWSGFSLHLAAARRYYINADVENYIEGGK